MNYCLSVDGNYIIGIIETQNEVAKPISAEERAAITSLLSNRPDTPEGYDYRLRADNLEWELVDLPPMPEPELTDAEALEILLGGDGT